ncbi:MAG: succinate dehydrogenase, hydrophobic membrane anchor protein [Alphaproteobacteria bacterium]|nr:succinate dehydrogenase, hydrophobic membrane anchor protein [Alphaproteobacteria bacterium]
MGGVRTAVMRSQLGRARGLGSAKSGAAHWWAGRVTALALVPLTLWFICAALRLLGASHDEVLAWIANPFVIVGLIALLLATFHHVQLGLQAVVDDYVPVEGVRLALLLSIKAVCFVFALAGIIAVLKMGL